MYRNLHYEQNNRSYQEKAEKIDVEVTAPTNAKYTVLID